MTSQLARAVAKIKQLHDSRSEELPQRYEALHQSLQSNKEEVLALAGSREALAVICDMLKAHAASATMQTTSLNVLQQLAAEWPIDERHPLRQSLAEPAVLAAMLAALRLHAWQLPVQRAGCAAVAQLAAHWPPVRQRLTEAGAVELVLKAVVSFASDLELHCHGCSLLCLLTSDDGHHEVARCWQQLVSLGGIELLVGLCRQYGCSQPRVLRPAVATLFHVALASHEWREQMSEAGLVEVLAGLLANHPEQPAVVEAMALTFKALLLSESVAVKVVPQHGVLEMLLELLTTSDKAGERHPAAPVLVALVGALRACVEAGYPLRFVSADGIAKVAAAVKGQLSMSASLLEETARLLGLLASQSAEYRSRLAASGPEPPVELVVVALKRHIESPAAVLAVVAMIRHFVRGTDDYKLRLGAVGAIETLMVILQAHASELPVVAVTALTLLCLLDTPATVANRMRLSQYATCQSLLAHLQSIHRSPAGVYNIMAVLEEIRERPTMPNTFKITSQ